MSMYQETHQNSEQLPQFNEHVALVHNRYNKVQADLEHKRAREVARILGLTEAQWVAAQCGALRSIRLAGRPVDIFNQIPRLGPVMALTRNDYCVHEKIGSYLNVQTDSPVGLTLGPDIDLRMFYAGWSHVWAVEENGRSSFQFFDHAGTAVHKVYCISDSIFSEYISIIGECSTEAIWPIPVSYPQIQARTLLPCSALRGEIDERSQFRSAWRSMTDTHDFYHLLKRFNVTRLAALQAAGNELASRVPPETVEEMLEHVSRSGMPIMCFVGNPGMLQIHTGAVKNIQRRGPWLNILDNTFNLHLDTTKIDSVWIVSKPTSDGWVTSMEVFAENGELIVQFFGSRKPGYAELSVWRELMLSLSIERLNQ